MSSAILYLAIIAIWACVLIPRWLKRDSAHTMLPPFSDTAVPDGVAAPGAASQDPDSGAGGTATAGTATAASPAPAPAARPPGTGTGTGDAPRPRRVPLSAEESRRRMLAARRRLLGMLILLEAAAIALVVLGLAAMWVVVPPTIMLAGYLLLLREAAHADAEHAQRVTAAAAARTQTMARSRHSHGARATEHPTPTAADLAARFAAAPVPADQEDPGRDFAPGLAGKYTTSNTDSERSDEDPYGYEEPRLRAVGD